MWDSDGGGGDGDGDGDCDGNCDCDGVCYYNAFDVSVILPFHRLTLQCARM